MSLSASLANALTGLTASSRRAEVVSSNVSNALTEGYARRELHLSPQSLGGTGAGVQIDGVTRAVDSVLLADRRIADAEAGNAGLKTDFLARIERLIGEPQDEGSLSARIAALESALVAASSRPDSQARLQDVVAAAGALTSHLGALSDDIQTARMQADDRIELEVRTLNESLVQIDRLNAEILAQRAAGRDATALMDQRQRLVDRVAEIVPVREVPRERDQIALFTTGGAILLEGKPAVIGFTPAGVITADMTIGSGALSGLTINGMPVPATDPGVLGGGTLGAALAIRDDLAPGAQAQIDAFARDLIERFEDPAVDPTRAPGQPGLFTDAGGVLDPTLEAGLAGRIRLNALVDPSQGGALWRLRAGLGAAGAGDVGDATLLNALGDALGRARVPSSGGFIGAARSASGLAADVLSGISGARQQAESRQGYAVARQSALIDLQLADGVDTDAEMQTLLMVEQAYSANARVIQVIDDLIQKLIGL
ncbi:flagellar hook-associated protein FlgK [Defluviimonas salinarum]|uniref:Flagellar hook-associated protein 1 n=1 Tax=Defluviimonas salinarum TaxID=2992147 RepID=A0ABT3J3L0_9RHOB|nr:flagellar hook-associated protein FlgK [Defluviimonas salinarum]MCW3782050.1 flagellar hook-associated protein FlgK [Defluviimonas salinarum]